MIFNLNDLTQIYLDIIRSLLIDQQKLNNLFTKLFNSDTQSNLLEEYSKVYIQNIHFIHQFYLKYPLIEVSPTSSPVQAYMYQNHSLSLTLIQNSSDSSMTSSIKDIDFSVSSMNDSEFSKSFNSESIENKEEKSNIVNHSELEFNEVIGSGSSCKVYKGMYNNEIVAIKLMKTSQRDDNFMKEFNREIQALSRLNHPNLVSFKGACVGEKYCIVTEYCAGNTLFKLLHEKKHIKLS